MNVAFCTNAKTAIEYSSIKTQKHYDTPRVAYSLVIYPHYLNNCKRVTRPVDLLMYLLICVNVQCRILKFAETLIQSNVQCGY